MNTKLLWSKLFLIFLILALLSACKPTTPTSGSDIHLGLIWPEQASKLSPLIAIGNDSTLYVFDNKPTLHAIAPNGQERWAYSITAQFAGAPLLSHDGNSIYFITSNDELINIGTDGKVRWTFKADSNFSAVPIIAPDNTVYAHTRSGGQRVTADGKGQPFTWPEWTDQSQVAFDSKGQLALFDMVDRKLIVLAPDGQTVTQCTETQSINYGPVINQKDVVLYTLSDGTLVARDTTCKELWRFSLGTQPTQNATYPIALNGDNSLYVTGMDGRIRSIDATSGQPTSTIDPIKGNDIYIWLTLAKDGTLYALNQQAALFGFRDGKQIWSQPSIESDMPGPIELAPDGGLAFIQAGKLYFYTRDPQLVRTLPTPLPPPENAAQAQQEIVDFLVDFIVQEEIGGTANYIRNSGQPWVTEPPKANLIVWAPAAENAGSSFNFLKSDQPTKVWWYANDQLTETEDLIKSITEYKDRYMQKPASDIWAWGYYEFGIVSIGEDNQSAKVYVGASCGPLCGHGFFYTLQRGPNGKWWIAKSEHLWQS